MKEKLKLIFITIVLVIASAILFADTIENPEGEKMMEKVLKTRLLCDGMKGQNYWFNGCMEYLMECLGEDTNVYNYWFFSDITGDSLMQLYSKDIQKTAWCPSQDILDHDFLKKAFDVCGYDFEYITGINDENRDDYFARIKESIDKNIPVICRGGEDMLVGNICGYNGDELYYLVCDSVNPEIYSNQFTELIFVGAKKDRSAIAEIYRQTVLDIPSFILKTSTEEYSFGKQAFIDWAESFQNGTFDDVPAEQINTWNVHGTYLCMAGTNGCAFNVLLGALEMNPEMTFINELLPIYGDHSAVFHDLLGMQGGFNITPETIKDKALMQSISDKIMESAKICDDILAVFERVK